MMHKRVNTHERRHELSPEDRRARLLAILFGAVAFILIAVSTVAYVWTNYKLEQQLMADVYAIDKLWIPVQRDKPYLLELRAMLPEHLEGQMYAPIQMFDECRLRMTANLTKSCSGSVSGGVVSLSAEDLHGETVEVFLRVSDRANLNQRYPERLRQLRIVLTTWSEKDK